ncbi:hypothetical protein NDU88_011331 [Pleurodeles waltl]|uniref:Uncharacterized protein n=1 Tax=Pleurodeles waltl TaxID=8319 RepID=A0AAV7R1C1_PLEWA|nr:hypothetical protein NDU88_011331 [Pleurodeles waltl]
MVSILLCRLPVAGYQDPDQVEPEEDRIDVKEAGRAPSPTLAAPWVDHEQRRRGRATPNRDTLENRQEDSGALTLFEGNG